jgi:hypothetical protein
MSESSLLPPTSPNADAAVLIDWLRDRDIPCPLCGYNLRHLTTPRCPECGQELCLAVAAVEPFLKAWITLAASAAASAGIGILLLLVILREGWPGGNHPFGDLGICLFLGMIPVAVIIFRIRRRLLKLNRSAQWVLAGTSIAIFGIAMTLFMSQIR